MAEIEVRFQNGHSDDSFRGSPEPEPFCNCCPYGYHIDLDFVRFCEKLAKASGEPSLSKKLRRERRRQRQSMEVLLGLTKPIIWNIEQLLPSIVQENSSKTIESSVPPPVEYSPLHHSHDGLNKAVLDFEATLERTSKKREVSELDSLVKNHRMVDLNGGQSLKREGSPAFGISHDVNSLVEFDVMSVYNSNGGTSPGPLQNIREQMAISLKRMRELEEKVKTIPTLEFELDSLKNEKCELLDKLEKLRSTLRNAKQHLTEMKIEEKKNQTNSISIDVRKPNLRDFGTTCKVTTRDVGITPIRKKSRTVGTETVADAETEAEEVGKPFPTKSIEIQTKPDTETISTMTESRMPEKTADKKETRLSKTNLEGISLLPRSCDRASKGTQASTREPVTVLRVVEKREAWVQADGQKKLARDAGTIAKPKTYDASAEIRPKTRENGSSDDRITDLLCDKCKNLKTRNVGVGLGNVKLEEPKLDAASINRSKSFQLTSSKPAAKTRNIGVGTLVPVMKLTCTKGVGTNDLTVATTIRHVGMNTTKVNLVETGSETDEPTRVATINAGTNTVNVNSVEKGSGTDGTFEAVKCENCGRAENGEEQKKWIGETREVERVIGEGGTREVQPSRIPRPKSNQSTPVMERKKFMRQDTYTKLYQTPSPFDSEKKTNVRAKSTPEKSDSLSEEKIDVSLRKKTKSSLGQSPSSATDKSLAKDLKELAVSNSSEKSGSQFDEYYFDYDESYDDSSKRNSTLYSEQALFQPIQDESREKIKPTKEMKAAMKVVNDSLSKYPNGLPKQLKNASNIIQQEWFKVSSTASANPLDVEDYLDSFEEVSSTLLEFIVNMIDNNGNTAMHYAVSHGNFDVVSILLDSKVCNINKMNAAGYTCIMLVSLAQVRSETHRQVVKRLFQLADVNIRAKQHGQTALMLAVSHGRLDMVKLLLEAGADPNIQDGDGSTALMCAAEHGHIEIVKHILTHPECDTSIVDCDGSTALAIAMEAGNRDIGVLLYAREHFSSSRGGSPYTSLKRRKSKSSTSPNPNRKSDRSM